MDGRRNPSTETNLCVRRGDRTRPCDPWIPDYVLISRFTLSSHESGFIGNWLE
jgi:hypothetical protein